ncbi:MAG: histidine kinase [Bacteroidetes bacterium]|nr:histidine kinase [Bacteroidota bacterium]
MHRLLKYKLHHPLFWACYHYTWWTIAMGNPVKSAATIFLTPLFFKYLFYVICSTASVAFNLYVLMPRYLEKNRVGAYIAGLSLTIIASSCLIIPGYYLAAAALHSPVEKMFQFTGDPFIHFFFANTFPSTLASMTLGMSIKLTNDWIQSRRRQQMLEKERLESELKFLKYQFNPHFLFNTINSIFFLIHKNPDKASASLAKFSELLRHQLYECNDQQIALTKEISYLKNFIQLQRLRQNDNVEIAFQLNDEQAERVDIAPFILMTFVENAFKHVSAYTDGPSWIKIALELQGQQLSFSISNSNSPAPAHNSIQQPGGIGLNNVRRRLDLIYPDRYQLTIQNNSYSFDVELKLQLTPASNFRTLQKIA